MDNSPNWKDNMMSKVGSMRTSMSTKFNQLRSNPAVLGGAATAAGLAVGLAGRWMRHRAHAPRIIVIQAV